MGAIVFKVILLVQFLLLFGTCSLLESGYDDKYGQYVPKIQRFKLKDKKGIFPIGLDTVNVYKLEELYGYNGLIYPKTGLTDKENKSYLKELNMGNYYIKFYPNGRCLEFATLKLFDSQDYNSLRIEDLNPNNNRASKNYYYSSDGKNIQVENFVWGDGQGHYVISNYTLIDSGNTLKRIDNDYRIIYKRVEIPSTWNKYNVDW